VFRDQPPVQPVGVEFGAMDPSTWTPAIGLDQLPEGKGVRVTLDGTDLLFVRSGEGVLAVANRCTHQGAPLHKGVLKLTGSMPTVQCAVHGSVIRLRDGGVLRGPATQPLLAYDARVDGSTVEVRPRA
jgi:nitrite reductase/ring-hydroxylating ferredoxin subunit